MTYWVSHSVTFPFRSHGDLLDIGNLCGHHIYYKLLIIGLDRALATIMAFLSAIVAVNLPDVT